MKRIGAIVINGETYNFWAIKEKFGFVSRRVLYYVGQNAAEDLYSDEVKSRLREHQVIGGVPVSKTGRRMVSFSLSKNNGVVVRSYPMNVYRAKGETGPRSMKREAGKKIFRSFESGLNVTRLASEALGEIMPDADNPTMNRLLTDWGFMTRLKATKNGLKEGEAR